MSHSARMRAEHDFNLRQDDRLVRGALTRKPSWASRAFRPHKSCRPFSHPHRGQDRERCSSPTPFRPSVVRASSGPTKFVKYLPQFGWDASVLTVSNPSVPLRDESLCRDIPAATCIVRARTLEPSYSAKAALVTSRVTGGQGPVLQTTSVRGTPGARVVAATRPADSLERTRVPARSVRALREDSSRRDRRQRAAIFVAACSEPRSAAPRGVPLVLDYRDEWAISQPTLGEPAGCVALSIAIQRAMERYALRRATCGDCDLAAERRRADGRLCREAHAAAASRQPHLQRLRSRRLRSRT